MVITSPLNLKRVTTSAGESKKKVTETRDSVKNIGKILFRRTKVKREAFAQTNLFRKRREENEKRQQQESELEAPRLVVNPTGPLRMIQATGVGGFFDRILGFLGYLSAGWLMNNLPTWIAMGKEFVARIQKAGDILSGFFNNTIKLFVNTGNILGALGQNLIQLDFFDTSNRVKNAMGELNGTVENLTSQIEEAFGLLTTPLTEGKYSGEKIPEVGTQYQDEGAYERPAPYSGSGGGNKASVGSPEQRAMLDAIAFAEGTRDQPNGGYKTLFGFEQFDDYSRHPDRVVRKGGYASAAAGRYQFMPGTFNRLAKKLGLKDFSPRSQDLAALELAKELGITPEVLQREGMSPKVSALLGRQWASFPGKSIGLDQPTKRLKDIQKAYNISLKSPQQSERQPARQQPSQSLLPKLPPTDTLRGGVQRYGASRDSGARRHAGTDFDIRGNEKFYSRIGGVVTKIGYNPGGYGNYVDIYNAQLGVYERIAEGARVLVNKGQTIQPGQAVVQGEGPTGVIHYEIRKNAGYGFAGTLNPIEFLKNTSTQPQIAAIPAQITAPARQTNTVPFSLTPERRGQDVMVVVPQQQQNIITPASGGGGVAPSPISDFELLNNFIKNKLLLDLAYV